MTLIIQNHPYAYEMECLTRIFFPGAGLQVIKDGEGETGDIVTALQPQPDGSTRIFVQVKTEEGSVESFVTKDPATSSDELEWAMARMLYRLLREETGTEPRWGILTGVRPVRLCRNMAGGGMDEGEIRQTFAERYLASQDKIDLTLDIYKRQERLIAGTPSRSFSLYISIPFCPTRCLYCSFVSHAIQNTAKLVPEYVRLLCEEIRHTGKLAKQHGLRLQTVYMGGGTPTTLEPEQLDRIMTAVAESFDLSGLQEYTVEAGRPDTITEEKLRTLKRHGVDRVSINPQTMDDTILQNIGRSHTAQAIRDSYALAREIGFRCINMDLIAGLPGETGRQFSRTLDEVLEMRPENITVHTLTVKRSSHLREKDGAFAPLPLDVSKLLDEASRRLGEQQYAPYYLYRQKGTVQNLENTGYALEGTESLYNILIMEEVQTILAVGAGAVSKLYLDDRDLKRIFNFKFPYEYISRFDEMLQRKTQGAEWFHRLW